jgi:hypothetical protein
MCNPPRALAGLSELGDAVATVEAGQHGVRAVLGTGKGANRAERVRGVKASQNSAMWRWCRVAEGSPWWSGGGGAPACVVWPQEWATAYRT